MGSFWKYGFMSWKINVKPYLLNDKESKLNQSETLKQRKVLYMGIHEDENQIHLILSLVVSFSFMLKYKKV